jgi:hypothetical protein
MQRADRLVQALLDRGDLLLPGPDERAEDRACGVLREVEDRDLSFRA